MEKEEIQYIQEIIANKSFSTFLQPIYSLNSMEVFAYEILNRPINYDTELFYSNVLKYNLAFELDELLVEESIKLAEYIDKNVFINIFPTSISIFESIKVPSNKLIFELSEKSNVVNFKKTREQIEELKIIVALDDFGSEYSGIKNIIELKPTYIKIDRYLVDGVDSNLEKQDLIRLLVNYCSGKHLLIAEGIENPEELSFLKNVGVSFGQGYLIGEPQLIEKLPV